MVSAGFSGHDQVITLDELDAALGAPLTDAVGADGCRLKNLRHLTKVNRIRLLILHGDERIEIDQDILQGRLLERAYRIHR